MLTFDWLQLIPCAAIAGGVLFVGARPPRRFAVAVATFLGFGTATALVVHQLLY